MRGRQKKAAANETAHWLRRYFNLAFVLLRRGGQVINWIVVFN